MFFFIFYWGDSSEQEAQTRDDVFVSSVSCRDSSLKHRSLKYATSDDHQDLLPYGGLQATFWKATIKMKTAKWSVLSKRSDVYNYDIYVTRLRGYHHHHHREMDVIRTTIKLFYGKIIEYQLLIQFSWPSKRNKN